MKLITNYNNDELFFNLFSNVADCILVINNIGEIVYLNPTAERFLSISAIDFVGRSINLLINRFDNVKADHLIEIKNNNQQLSINLQIHSLPFGQEVYDVLLLKKAVEDKKMDDEHLTRLIKEIEDIELAINESSNVSVTDGNGVITMVNKNFCNMTKYSEEEVIGKTHRILNSGFHPNEFFREMWDIIKSGKVWRGEIQNKSKDGALYWHHTTIVPFLDDEGKAYKFVSVRNDITKRVKMEQALQINFMDTIENLQNGIFKMKKDANGNLIYTMAAGKLMNEIGTTKERLQNQTPFDVFPEEMAKMKYNHYEKAFKEGKRVNYEIELQGKLIYVDVTPVKHKGVVTEIVCSVLDVSELRTTQRELQVNQEQYQSLFKYSHDYIVVFDVNGNIIDINPKTKELFGISNELKQNLTIEDIIQYENLGYINSYLKKAGQGEIQYFELEMIQNGEKLCLNMTLLPIVIDGNIKGIYFIGKDITENKRVQETNAYLAHHDELTKLLNRRGMNQNLCDSIIDAEETNSQLAILMIDLDRFKFINDSLGHLIGDQLLAQIASRLLETIDETNFFAARMGGDEFMVLCPKLESNSELVLLAETIGRNLAKPYYIEKHELFITASIGISIYPTSGTTVVELMKRADIALYQSKELGRNTYQIYDESMRRKSEQLFFLERDLRKAILNNEFIAHFQPRVNALTGETISAEALIRWEHPVMGLISPGDFIPLAEETGLIIPLGKWMKRKVCEQLVAWREAGIPLIPISVNISSQRFLQKEFAKDLQNLLDEFQLEGKWLEIEITENSIMKNEEYILQTLRDLKELGVKIYIDDFGTGYSSFNYLKTFNIDGIKIDRSFIQNISSKSENASITTAMIKMAQHLKMDVIAEGVETKEELMYLLEQNCYHIQGYYFGKPCSIEEFETQFLFQRS
ncbi:EAL domain-containing protein [Ureibacillus composti]|nr:EAL domain-containing protein [Ureibacillus composti]